jgi:hypothetical protein
MFAGRTRASSTAWQVPKLTHLLRCNDDQVSRRKGLRTIARVLRDSDRRERTGCNVRPTGGASSRCSRFPNERASQPDRAFHTLRRSCCARLPRAHCPRDAKRSATQWLIVHCTVCQCGLQTMKKEVLHCLYVLGFEPLFRQQVCGRKPCCVSAAAPAAAHAARSRNNAASATWLGLCDELPARPCQVLYGASRA